MKKAILLTMFLAIFLAIGFDAQADNILITQFDFSGYTQMRNTLAALGHTVDIVDARTGGNVAAALGATAYDQVYLFDLTSTPYLNAADLTALGLFWNDHRGLVIDSRSYGYHFQPTDPSEVRLLQNVADNFLLTGGGVWVGTDHDPDWTRNGNPFLAEIGVNPVTGIHSEPVNFADPSSVLLAGVTPADLWGGGASIGQVPLGLQPNGIEMFLHFGHIDPTTERIIPYISASFPLQGPSAPEPATLFLMAIGLLGLRRFRPK